MIRTTVNMPKDVHKALKREAMDKEVSLNELLMSKILSTLKSEEKELKKRALAFNSIKKLRVKINTKGINYRELIDNGRRY